MDENKPNENFTLNSKRFSEMYTLSLYRDKNPVKISFEYLESENPIESNPYNLLKICWSNETVRFHYRNGNYPVFFRSSDPKSLIELLKDVPKKDLIHNIFEKEKPKMLLEKILDKLFPNKE